MKIYTQDDNGSKVHDPRWDAFVSSTSQGDALLDLKTWDQSIRLECSHEDLLKILSLVSLALSKTHKK